MCHFIWLSFCLCKCLHTSTKDFKLAYIAETQYKIQLTLKKTKSMKNNREIHFAEPPIGDNHHSLKITLARGSLADEAKRQTYCASSLLCKKRWIMILSIKFKVKCIHGIFILRISSIIIQYFEQNVWTLSWVDSSYVASLKKLAAFMFAFLF